MSGPRDDRRALAVFDVCDTLYAMNTTAAFLQMVGQKRTGVATALTRWTSPKSPVFYLGAICHRLFKLDLARARLIAALRTIPQQELEASGRQLASERLPMVANAVIHERLERHRKRGDDILLLSSSLNAVVGPIAETLGVPYRASELEYVNGICTGRLKRDLTGRKASALREAAPGTCSKLWVYTDNRSDADILALADERIIVVPAGQTRGQWGKNASEHIQL